MLSICLFLNSLVEWTSELKDKSFPGQWSMDVPGCSLGVSALVRRPTIRHRSFLSSPFGLFALVLGVSFGTAVRHFFADLAGRLGGGLLLDVTVLARHGWKRIGYRSHLLFHKELASKACNGVHGCPYSSEAEQEEKLHSSQKVSEARPS